MLGLEKKIVNKLLDYFPQVCIAIATVLGVYARYTCRDFISHDMSACLLDWYYQMTQFKGFKEALSTQVGDYNIPYQTIIYLFTKLPFRPIVLIKGMSCLFDLLIAAYIGYKVREYTCSDNKGAIGFIAIFMLPTVLMNSALWGQCDSIYSFFAIVALFALVEKKYKKSFVFLGLAFVFKLQTIFILPIFIVVYLVKKEYSILHFLIIPVIVWIASLPGIIAGRGFLSPFQIYMGQVGESYRLSYYFPNIWWLFMPASRGEEAVTLINETLKFAPVAITVCVMMMYAIWIVKNEISLEKKENILVLTVIGTMLLLMFLPAMHERYAYIVEILVVFFALCNRKGIISAVLIELSGVISYRNHLTELEPPEWGPLFNIIALVIMIVIINRQAVGEKN